MQQIFFIGLGNMGMPMALNLLKNGYKVTGFDISPLKVKEFAALGGSTATTLAEAKTSQVGITMLQTGTQVQEVCLNQAGEFNLLEPGALFIDCSTIDIASSLKIKRAADAVQVAAIDAPVSGGVGGARLGSLTFMVGGETSIYTRAVPILSAMGKQIIHAGNNSCGQAAKMCNNMILGIMMTAVSEAFSLATKSGLTAQKFHEIATKASGQCWVMDNYVPVPDVLPDAPANHDYAPPAFTVAMMLKDLSLSQEAAGRCNVNTPMGALACKLYDNLAKDGYKDKDCSVIFKWLNKFKE
ncbi:MAG: 3-hydroxyisobutyrate dehydrogenase [Gammaproteobacteria bacterium RIFCSPHIGHO2_12_FULL_41_15]|nr:MAG: 3-hydroxyisobutyrate dehydrogenase [Gammaproteobacteria bacterium RIFCSPHIGHO2_12_FULL_41_15]